MKELMSSELDQLISNREPFMIVFAHTPLCGTCKMARRMLEIIEETYNFLPFYSININQAPLFAEKWKIESVPCLLLFQKGLGVKRVYAFQSITHIHELLKPYVTAWTLQSKE